MSRWLPRRSSQLHSQTYITHHSLPCPHHNTLIKVSTYCLHELLLLSQCPGRLALWTHTARYSALIDPGYFLKTLMWTSTQHLIRTVWKSLRSWHIQLCHKQKHISDQVLHQPDDHLMQSVDVCKEWVTIKASRDHTGPGRSVGRVATRNPRAVGLITEYRII